jgi:hypothetical protein
VGDWVAVGTGVRLAVPVAVALGGGVRVGAAVPVDMVVAVAVAGGVVLVAVLVGVAVSGVNATSQVPAGTSRVPLPALRPVSSN